MKDTDLGTKGVDSQERHRLQVKEGDFSIQEWGRHRGEGPGWSFGRNGEEDHLCYWGGRSC